MSGQRALLFDIGNTRIKWGITADGAIRKTGSITHERINEQGLAAITTKLPTDIDRAYACNVAGQSFATRLSGVIGLHLGSDVHFVRSQAEAHGVTNSYRQPRRLGVDRWVAMIGARDVYRKAVCVVDAGTAVTIDALDRTGRHLGGQILPGLRLMMESLAEDTSDLPAVRRTPANRKGDAPDFATSTANAIFRGSLGAVCGAIERAVRRMKMEGHRPQVVLTGGDASRILAEVDVDAEHRPHLVLEGLAVIARDRQ